MSTKDTAWRSGKEDAQGNKGPAKTSTWSWQTKQSYDAGYQSGKKDSGKSGK